MKPHIIQSGDRCPILAYRRKGGGLALTAGHVTLYLDTEELDQFVDILEREGFL